MASTRDDAFVANEEILTSLMALGIDRSKAEEALFCTGNDCLDAAVSFLMCNDLESEDSSVEETISHHKMVFVVNLALDMSVGKVAAQVAHACLSLYRDLLVQENMEETVKQWERAGEKKVVLKGKDHMHLNQLYEEAMDRGVTCQLIHDAGRTEIPRNSLTVLGLFGLEEDVNKMPNELLLLEEPIDEVIASSTLAVEDVLE